MRLVHLLPCGALLLGLTAACGDESTKHDPDDSGGAGGAGDESGGKGGSGGKASGGTRAGSAGKGGKSGEGGMGGEMPGPDQEGGSAGSGEIGGAPSAGAGGEEPDPVDCSKLATAPAEFEELPGFTSSEDFVFDELGNYVGVDGDNNLVRISKTGKKELMSPAIGGTAGMGILPDGSVIVADVGNGALKRVYIGGGYEVVIGGLLYPNGLDIGPDGFVYVCENFAGRVRRVNPDNGAFTIVAMGLHGCNGVAFSNDPKLLYIGSFEGSGVYKVEIPAPGELGVASVFARPPGSRLPPPKLACPDQVVGTDCTTTTGGNQGKCKQLSNVVDCVPAGPCDDVPEGGDCQGGTGTCTGGSCIPKNNCQKPGDPDCTQDPCDGKNAGDECTDPLSGAGKCVHDGADGLYCEPLGPCAALNAGDVCTFPWGGEGKCVDTGKGQLSCEPPDPCDDLHAGDVCTFPWGEEGKCVDDGDGPLSCQIPNPCSGKNEGDACTSPNFGPGTCEDFGGDELSCEPVNPCDGLNAGDECTDPFSGEGTCVDLGAGSLYCQPPNPCDGLSAGDECTSPEVGEGVCVGSKDQLYCSEVPCSQAAPGDVCYTTGGLAGVCEGPIGGPLACIAPCDGKPDGTECKVDDLVGECHAGYCTTLCTKDNVGEPCVAAGGSGTCGEENGKFVCQTTTGDGGGIDGLGVDACGYVYASEYVKGNVWRISPAGEIELLANVPSDWIPNIKWGRGLGGFSKDIMYVADRKQGRLFGVTVGVPGVTEYYDLVSQ
jgi:sugar lactone lactonase YvrE